MFHDGRGDGHRPASVAMALTAFLLTCLVTLSLLACSGSRIKNDPSAPRATERGPSPQYYDFGDVLVPEALTLEPDDSFVYRTSDFSAGVLVLKGRVEMDSLIRFFENNMRKDNWHAISTFKSPRTIMLFQKEQRWCVINITDGGYTTHVEIWVAPTMAPL